MLGRGVVGLGAAAMLVFGAAVPAQAQDGCTSELLRKLVTAEDPGSPYPIVVIGDDLSVHVYPQNVAPGTLHAVDSAIASAGQTVGHVLAWVDCVD